MTTSVIEFVDVYARVVDKLAAVIEAEAEREARVHVAIATALGELYVGLDELRSRLERGMQL